MPYRMISLLCFVVLLVTLGVRGFAAEPQGSGKMVFSHIGIITTEKKPGERFVPATRVWVTDFQNHPFHVEWLRFEPDSPVSGPLRIGPHIGYRVDNVDAILQAASGLEVLLEPFDAGFAVAGFYRTRDGAVVELVTYKDGPSPWEE